MVSFLSVMTGAGASLAWLSNCRRLGPLHSLETGVPLGLYLEPALPGLRQQYARVAQSAASCWS